MEPLDLAVLASANGSQVRMDDWESVFTQVPNHFSNDESIQYFDTAGKEFDFVKSQPTNRIWTIVDGGDSGGQYLLPGLHYVNRVGYILTEESWGSEIEGIEVVYFEADEDEIGFDDDDDLSPTHDEDTSPALKM